MSTDISTTDPDALVAFTESRGRLFGIAYRILGSAADAEDVVQETWVRWQLCDRDVVREPAAFLATTTTRLAINVLNSARVTRETYIGPWLPAPVDTSADPALGAERDEALHFATLMMMERLTPTERAAYVLREAFDYPYARIAEIIESTQTAARQLVSRARKHLGQSQRRHASAASHHMFLRAFLDAARSGDTAKLETLLATDVVSHTDGGGVVRHTARRPIVGREKVVRFLAGLSQWFWGDVEVEPLDANGRSAVFLRHNDDVFAVLTVTVQAGAISQVLWIMNPAKIAPIGIHASLHIGRPEWAA
ncbi:RNA polymerase sigma-70 factor [Microbacterium insulae]|uniref:RNA polymerase sigma-70 factor n=1 Tax=Microbacterium insulae TaxID=483014 RepID=A0ABW3AI43_9MICO